MKKLFFVLSTMNMVLFCQAQEAERKLASDNYVKCSTQAMTVKNAKKEEAIKQYNNRVMLKQ